MNVIIIGQFTNDAFGFHIKDALTDMNINVIPVELTPKLPKLKSHLSKRFYQIKRNIHEISLNFNTYRRLRIKKVIDLIENNNIDLIICTHDYLYPDDVKSIKQYSSAKIVLWFPDAVSRFKKELFLIAGYDFLFFKDPYIINILKRQINIPVIYLPECCNPKYHYYSGEFPPDEKYACDICTAGTFHPSRVSFFENLVSRVDYNIKIYGPPPPLWMQSETINKLNQNRYVTYHEKIKAFRNANIVINNIHPTEIEGVNVRTFEISASRAFQLVDYRPGLNDLYEINKEIVTFDNIADAVNKIKYYIDNKNARKEISLAAEERSIKDHTYKKRLSKLLSHIS